MTGGNTHQTVHKWQNLCCEVTPSHVSHQEVEFGVRSHLENVIVPGVLGAVRMEISGGSLALFFFLSAGRRVKLPVVKGVLPRLQTSFEQSNSLSWQMNYWHLKILSLVNTHSL